MEEECSAKIEAQEDHECDVLGNLKNVRGDSFLAASGRGANESEESLAVAVTEEVEVAGAERLQQEAQEIVIRVKV